MNLLLLLSALLSALTGVGGAARAPRVAQAVACGVECGRVTPAAKAVAVHRPAAMVATLASVASAVFTPGRTPAPHAPIWTGRPRV